MARFFLSVEKTAEIIAACNKRGVSVTAAFYTALATTSQPIQAEHGPKGRYVMSFHHFEARPWFKQTIDTRNFLGLDPHAILPFALDMGEDKRSFRDLAFDANKFFKSYQTEFAADATGLDFINDLLRSFLRPETPAPNLPIFSVSV
ncbi:uncharacterized protein BCR38DRAFT_410398 [Pseudomassariella vexata]|uniref:Uncharacterized protein n=1 Tax=Pseudomassariella vexata TaxID=1141098 RepID=A0A1Y2DWK3_9PEZI|nr:uncharacterized protein BCR38DRAFT_410398 [Pseudomassariella vexata]ORY63484.1 hypothetical protein BCR38DRAFT_410398 [Pseudomassariella vexata]